MLGAWEAPRLDCGRLGYGDSVLEVDLTPWSACMEALVYLKWNVRSPCACAALCWCYAAALVVFD